MIHKNKLGLFLITFLILCLAYFSVAAAALESEKRVFATKTQIFINELTQLKIPKNAIGISLIKIPNEIYPFKPVIYGFNARKKFNPASTVKLLTSYYALANLGKSFRFKTEFFAQGEKINKSFTGNFYMRGRGDPKLVYEDLQEIVLNIRGTGLEQLNGKFIFDDSFFSEPDIDVSMFDGKKNKPYNVGPNATLVNFKAVELTVKKINRKLDVSIHPPLADVKIKNNIRWLRGNCSRNKIYLREMEGTLAVSGTFGTRCKRRRLYIGILSHDKFAYSMFKQLWIDSGGSFKQVLQRGVVPENVKPFYIWHNPRELGSLLKDINTLSNNPMARNLFLNFSSKMDEAGSLQKSRKILSEWFQEKSIFDTPVLIDNGAGLSRKTKITPEDLSSLLADAVLNDEFVVWRNSLARAGKEGTTINRFRGMEVSGRAWVKTGSLEGVQAISGYIFTQKNEWVIFTVFVNHKKADKVKLILDKFVNLLYLDK